MDKLKKKIMEIAKTPAAPMIISFLWGGYIMYYINEIVGFITLMLQCVFITWGALAGYYTKNK